MPDDLLTAQEAADYLKLKKTTVYELVKRGDIPSTKIGKQLRVPRAALEGMTGAPRPAEPPKKPFLRESGRPGAILCGQDSSLDMIADFVTSSVGNGAVVLRSHAGSYNSLTMLYHGKVDMATAHLWDEATGTYNLPYISKLLPGMEVTAVRLFGRTTGIYVPTGNPKGIEGCPRWPGRSRIINREKGSGVRVLVDEKRKAMGLSPRQIRGYDEERTSHMTVAAAVASGEADYGFGAEAASRMVDGVDFLPIQLEWYDLVLPTARREEPAFRAVLDYVTSQRFRRDLEQTGRYDRSQTGIIFEL